MPNDVPDYTSVTQTYEQALGNSPFTLPRDGLFHTLGTFTLQPGVEALVLVTATPADIENLTVTGQTTQTTYQPTFPISRSKFIYVRVHPSVDAAYLVRVVISSGVGNAIVGLSALYGNSVQVLNQLVNSAVFLEASNGNALSTDLANGVYTLGVSFLTAQSAGWQSALNVIDVNISSMANNTTRALRAGVLFQTITLFHIHIGYDVTNSNVTIEDDTSGAVLWRGTYNQNESGLTNSSNFETPGFGAAAGSGNGLLIRNTTGGTRNIFGSIYVRQQ